jgi:hypothetical protein
LIVNHSRRFDAFYRRALKLVTDGVIGELDAGASGTIDPGGSAYVRYKGGAHAFMNADARNAVPLQLDIIGSQGKIVIGNYNLELWKRNRESSLEELVCHQFPAWMAMDGVGVVALRDLIHYVETGEASISNGHVARAALGCCPAVHDSARQGNCLITFPYTNMDLDVACR